MFLVVEIVLPSVRLSDQVAGLLQAAVESSTERELTRSVGSLAAHDATL